MFRAYLLKVGKINKKPPKCNWVGVAPTKKGFSSLLSRPITREVQNMKCHQSPNGEIVVAVTPLKKEHRKGILWGD